MLKKKKKGTKDETYMWPEIRFKITLRSHETNIKKSIKNNKALAKMEGYNAK